MAGYSGTPLAKKLGIKPGARVALIGAPSGFRAELEPLPEDARITTRAGASFDVALCFVKKAAALDERLAKLQPQLAVDGGLWIAWPKKSSGVATDLSFDVVQRAGLALGLVDNKVCAVNETWSGLRFVYRREDRAAVAGKKSKARPAKKTSAVRRSAQKKTTARKRAGS